MATYALLAPGGTVINIIVAEPYFVEAHYPSAVEIDSVDPMPGIGWRYAMGEFTAPGN